MRTSQDLISEIKTTRALGDEAHYEYYNEQRLAAARIRSRVASISL